MSETVKQLCALTAAWALGLWTGVNYVAQRAVPEIIFGSPPAWVSQAERMALIAVALFAFSVIAWLALDVRQRGIDTNRIREVWPEVDADESAESDQ